jgi:hypothetical protein
MKLFVICSGFLGLMYCIWGIINMNFMYHSFISLITQILDFNGYLGYLLGMFIAGLTLLVAFKPNDPFPWHWILIFMFSILSMLFIHIIVGAPAFVAGIIGLFNDA